MDQTTAIEAFSSLAQTSRMAIYRLLVRAGPKGMLVGEIAKSLNILPSTLSGHLSLLKRAGLLTATRNSREISYSANLKVMNELVAFMLADCCDGQVENCADILTLLRAS